VIYQMDSEEAAAAEALSAYAATAWMATVSACGSARPHRPVRRRQASMLITEMPRRHPDRLGAFQGGAAQCHRAAVLFENQAKA